MRGGKKENSTKQRTRNIPNRWRCLCVNVCRRYNYIPRRLFSVSVVHPFVGAFFFLNLCRWNFIKINFFKSLIMFVRVVLASAWLTMNLFNMFSLFSPLVTLDPVRPYECVWGGGRKMVFGHTLTWIFNVMLNDAGRSLSVYAGCGNVFWW